MEELWSLDKEQSDALKPVFGLVFLFKWVKDDTPMGTLVEDSRLDKIFFAQQIINNACATQAILSILMNTESSEIELGRF